MPRPTKYEDRYAEQARKLCEMGATDMDLAGFFDVVLQTIYNWRAIHPEFLESSKVGKGMADDRVERSLYQRALGYSCPEDKILNHGGKPLVVPTIKHYPPDPTSCIYWLKNRRPDSWRDQPEDTGETPQTVNIHFVRDND